jgi:uncharacterized protein DUF3592
MKATPLIGSLVSLTFGVALWHFLAPSLLDEVRIAAFSSVWPITRGTILETQSQRWSGRRVPSAYLAIVRFRYDVSEHMYTRSQVLCECTSPSTADNALRNFPKGAQTSVFYDPISPSLSVVETRGFDAAFLVKWGLEVTAILLFIAVLPITLWVLSSNRAPHRDGREASHLD